MTIKFKRYEVDPFFLPWSLHKDEAGGKKNTRRSIISERSNGNRILVYYLIWKLYTDRAKHSRKARAT